MFWELTLYEVSLIIEGVSNNWKRQHDELLFHAWHTAYLTAYAPQKPNKFVKLEKLIGATSRTRGRRMTPEEIEAVTRSWLAGRKRGKTS